MELHKNLHKLIILAFALFGFICAIGLVVNKVNKTDSGESVQNNGKSKSKTVVITPNPKTDFMYDFTEDKKALEISGYKGLSTTIIIPEEIEGFPVRRLGVQWLIHYSDRQRKDIILLENLY